MMINLTLDLNDINNKILVLLKKMPYEQVDALIGSIHAQVTAQVKAAEQIPPPVPPPT